jgi:hypothetical protein
MPFPNDETGLVTMNDRKRSNRDETIPSFAEKEQNAPQLTGYDAWKNR